MANSDGTFEYQYFLKDHLGNTRVTFNQVGEVIQEDSYYPFGMAMNGLNFETGLDYKNKYLYNGKELQDEFGLGWYDYGARFYDAQLGRWHVVDILAEEASSWSPFRYGFNNPISAVDPDGNFEDWFQNELSGDVYYNSVLRKGDEGTGAMTGEGWVHMGENRMFGTDDQLVIMNNSENAEVGYTNVTVCDPNTGESTGQVGLRTAMFKGGNAISFMSGQGYDLKPVLFKYHSDVTTEFHPEPHGQVTISHNNSRVEGVLSSKYVHQDMVLKRTNVLKKYKDSKYDPPKYYGPMYSIREQSWTIRQNVYGTHALGRKVGKTIKTLEKIVPWKSIYENSWKKK